MDMEVQGVVPISYKVRMHESTLARCMELSQAHCDSRNADCSNWTNTGCLVCCVMSS